MVEYTYSPWGEVLLVEGLDVSLGELNPIRYRGYYYDEETGFYYLHSRYYDPAVGRFINADAYVSTGQGVLGYNMYAYCGNNPVNRIDSNGQFFDVIADVISIVLGIKDVCENPDDSMAWASLAFDTACLFVPVVSGGGTAVKMASKADDIIDVAKTANKVDNVVDTTKATQKGWKLADDITTLTKSGKDPSWSTVKSRYWKNEAYLNAQKYTDTELLRMKKGLAPRVEFEGYLYPMELHHIVPRRNGGTHEYGNLLKVEPWIHDAIDPYRHFKPL